MQCVHYVHQRSAVCSLCPLEVSITQLFQINYYFKLLSVKVCPTLNLNYDSHFRVLVVQFSNYNKTFAIQYIAFIIFRKGLAGRVSRCIVSKQIFWKTTFLKRLYLKSEGSQVRNNRYIRFSFSALFTIRAALFQNLVSCLLRQHF